MATPTREFPFTREQLERKLDEVISDPERLAAVRRTLRSDAPSGAALDRLTRLASHILDAPVALVSLVDDEEHRFASDVGLPEPYATTRTRPLARSFCHYTIAAGHPLVIEDASEHPLVRENPATEEFGIGGYLGMPLVTSEGHGIGNFCVIDTEPRTWSDQQMRALDDLAASVITEIEARAYAREAEAAVRTREEILAVVSHDLRSPLQSIVAGARMLDEPWLSGEDRERQLEVIRRSARRMDRLVGDLLDVAKMKDRGFVVEPEEGVEPMRVVADALASFRAEAREEGVELEERVSDDLPPIRADAPQLVRVLENLVSNAVRHTPAGGRVVVRAEPEGEVLELSVADTGPGIAREDLDRLFEFFWRGDGRRGDAEGTGLGLPIAKGIVEAHGGHIDVETSAGEGSLFRARIPVDGPQPEESSNDPGGPAGPRPSAG